MKITRKMKIIGAASTAAAVAVAASLFGTLAFFQDKENVEVSGTAGAVELATEQINLNGVQMSITGHGYDFDRGTYNGSGSVEITEGWAAPGSTEFKKVSSAEMGLFCVYHKCAEGNLGLTVKSNGNYVCESCGTQLPLSTPITSANGLAKAYFFIDYFRTKEGLVGYCIDRGKIAPSTGILNMTAEVSPQIKRALAVGYPSKSYSDYAGLTEDWQLEQATTLALYVIEGKSYNEDGTQKGYGLTREWLESHSVAGNAETMTAILNAMDSIVAYAMNESNPGIGTFVLNSTSTEATPADSASFVGPYVVEAANGTTVNLTTSTSGVKFYDAINGNEITNVAANNNFYVKIPSSVKDTITITASANIEVIPNYYYWGNNVAEQRMVVASKIPAKVSANISKINQLMPGDVVDVNWTVENTQNKAVVTRNRVFVWWEGEKNGGNAIENTFLFKGNSDKGTIQTEMADGSITDTSILFNGAGNIKDFTLEDGTSHRGYSFTIMGDCLDGAGDNAEVLIPGTNKHYGEGAGEVSYDNGAYDDNDTLKDVIGFKLGFGQKANINTSGATLHVVVITEAIQYQNTTDAEFDTLDWTVTGRTSYVIN